MVVGGDGGTVGGAVFPFWERERYLGSDANRNSFSILQLTMCLTSHTLLQLSCISPDRRRTGEAEQVAHLHNLSPTRAHGTCPITDGCVLFSLWLSGTRVFTNTFSSVPRGHKRHDSASK